ncbi:MAG: hypothetical protein IJK26_09090 [Clostridia bacterium]|nr:hypothetical protein [Clostridia bacterium]
MKNLLELDMDNPNDKNALIAVLEHMPSAKVIARIQQAVKKGDGYEFNDLQVGGAETPVTIELRYDNLSVYITARDLKRNNVTKMQNMFRSVLNRGTKRSLEGEANDYRFVLDCITILKSKGKSYCFGIDKTPLFASSDGDDDLTFLVPMSNCYIDISNYSEKDADYEAMKQIERGKTIVPLLQEDYDLPEDEQ